MGNGGKRQTGKLLPAAIALAGLLFGSSAYTEEQQVYRIDLPAQSVAESLIELSEQIDVLLLFPSDIARQLKANPVQGRYTLPQALEVMLQGTGYTGGLSKKGVLMISLEKSEVATESKTKGEAMSKKTERNFFASVAAAVLSIFTSQGAVGQEAQGGQAGTTAVLKEIIVTAQKREERLIDVPTSIGVVTPEEIDRRGLVSAEDYLRGIPGVHQVADGFSGGAIVIRGLATSLSRQNLASGPTVATYFGETPTTHSAGLSGTSNVDLKLVDIERVEVLRGPQGTTFGSSSIAGAVRTIPVAPKLDRVEGKLAASYSRTSGTGGDNYNFQGVANLPLIRDKLALRAVGYRFEESGFYRNRAASNARLQQVLVAPYGAEAFAINKDEVGASTFTGGRLAALFQANDALRFTLSYLRQKTEIDGVAHATTGPYEQAILQVAPEHVVRGQTGGVLDTEMDVANATVEYNLGWANLLGTYSYTQGGTLQVIPWNMFPVALDFPVSEDSDSDHRAHVGEIRLATQLDGAWNFLVGLYAEELKDEALTLTFWHGDPATNVFGSERLILTQVHRRKLTQKAAFGEASWEFLPGFTLTGGVRVYDYDRSGRQDATGVFYGPAGLHEEGAFNASGTNFRSNLSYKLDGGGLLYAGWAEGFRLGSPQSGLPPTCDLDGDGIVDGSNNVTMESTRRVHADKTNSYELGGKFALLDGRVTIAADAFRTDWSGMPVTAIVTIEQGGCGIGFLANVGGARSEGVEFQANLQVTNAVRVDVGGSWIRARLTEDVPPLRALAGTRLPGSPELSANLGLQYEFGLAGQKPSLRADATYIGHFDGALRGGGNTRAGDYVKIDASVRVAIRDINVDFFVRNLTNENAYTFRERLTEFFGIRLRPRTIGLQLSRNF